MGSALSACCQHGVSGRQEEVVVAEPLSEADLEKGFDVLLDWFPALAADLNPHRQEIVEYVMHDRALVAGSGLDRVRLPGMCTNSKPSLRVEFDRMGQRTPLQIDTSGVVDELEDLAANKCLMNLLGFCVQATFFALSLCGLQIFGKPGGIVKAVEKQLNAENVHALRYLVQKYNETSDAVEKSLVLFELLQDFAKIGGLRAVLTEIANGMSQWDWIKTGVVAAAQITLWVATGGLGFVAKAAMCVLSAVELTISGKQVADCCFHGPEEKGSEHAAATRAAESSPVP